jgi:hypothetical protein
MNYEQWQKEVHEVNTMISSWKNCPCDACRERQEEYGLPIAEFAAPERARIAQFNDDNEPPF